MGKMLIPVSFKEREKDLYVLVSSQGDKSNFIKDALKFYLKQRGEKAKFPDISGNQSSGTANILESI